ncbi:MAG: hypothetical protein GJT30_00815 [Geobacter sp.]|nr:hypothetical protein [Geobacter sp.]
MVPAFPELFTLRIKPLRSLYLQIFSGMLLADEKNQARFNADLKIAELELMGIMDVKDFDLEKANKK